MIYQFLGISRQHYDQTNKKCFTTASNLSYFNNALATLSAEPRNSNDKSVANSTPFNACFFIRSTRTPQERPMLKESLVRHSMVACNGKGFALCSVPLIGVFEPVTRYRPQASKLQAVTSENLFSGVTAMKQFIFAAIKRTDLSNHIQKIRINANNEQEARRALSRQFILCFAGCINLENLSKTNRTLASKGGVYA